MVALPFLLSTETKNPSRGREERKGRERRRGRGGTVRRSRSSCAGAKRRLLVSVYRTPVRLSRHLFLKIIPRTGRECALSHVRGINAAGIARLVPPPREACQIKSAVKSFATKGRSFVNRFAGFNKPTVSVYERPRAFPVTSNAKRSGMRERPDSVDQTHE